MKCLIVVFLALLSLGCCQSNLNAYPFSAVLRTDGNGDPLYTLHWNFSATEETITFGVNVSTNGWVGFGISPNGGMANSDVVIGWVNDNGEVFFHVRKLSGSTRDQPSMHAYVQFLYANNFLHVDNSKFRSGRLSRPSRAYSF